ncbi:MAG: glutamyl-tRNA reductase, partial [Rhodospirillales bacterium]|nr:glutamyl-tRNA reductase [Rhodospirillales bacterium]
MSTNKSVTDGFLVVGANHRSSSLALRDRLFVEDADLPVFFGKLQDAGIDQAVVLSTCDRIEVHSVEENHQALDEVHLETAGKIVSVLAGRAGATAEELESQLYVLRGEAAVRHVFAVTSSLDSLVIGEPQVLGQIKAGHRMSRDAGMTKNLEPIFQAAYAVAKRVRTETEIGRRPVSIAATAVQSVRDLHGDLDRCSGLLIGVGEMGELVAEQLVSSGLGQLTVIHPMENRSGTLARKLGCHAAPMEALAGLLPGADIVLTALGKRQHVLTADMVSGALKARRHKPMFLVDTAIPGDIEPAVSRLEEAFLYDLGDLEHIALQGLASREMESKAAWNIVDVEVSRFLHGQA